jgi:hypothetical protein
MQRCWWLLVWLAIASAADAQGLNRQNLANILGFENNSRAGVFPAGWGGGPADGGIFADNQVVHSGTYSARIERNTSSSGTFTTLTASIPLDFAGRTIEWRGFLKWEDVNGFVALWLREDGDTPSLAFATLQGLNLNGTRDWTQFSISLASLPAGRQLFFGFLLSGTGKGWVDDLQLLVDGIPVAQAGPRIPTVFDNDHEFDQGSRVNVTGLSNVQIKNLATLAKVWGFLKYHHPAVTDGLHHWDYELFRILPPVLDAAGSTAANAAISGWVTRLGRVEECSPCASLNSNNLYLPPNVDWIRDESLLGADLSQALETIYRNRKPAARKFYVSLAAGVGNPVFENELNYASMRFPDSGYQLLALFRFWNMVQYFYPNRDILAEEPPRSPDYWNSVLEEFIPRMALASDTLAYQQELMRFIAKINDTHANLWSSLSARPPIGVSESGVRGRGFFPPGAHALLSLKAPRSPYPQHHGQPLERGWSAVSETTAIGCQPESVIAEDEHGFCRIELRDQPFECNLQLRPCQLHEVWEIDVAVMDQVVHGVDLFEGFPEFLLDQREVERFRAGSFVDGGELQ